MSPLATNLAFGWAFQPTQRSMHTRGLLMLTPLRIVTFNATLFTMKFAASSDSSRIQVLATSTQCPWRISPKYTARCLGITQEHIQIV